jgi:spore germination cell wall hydrolase CwlJ-like protein
MVPSKIPEIHTRSTMLLRLAVFLLIGSIVLNVGLWHSVTEQGNKIYKEVVALSPPLQQAIADIAAKVAYKEPEVPADASGVDDTQLKCMATNIYHESANESDLGKIAVAMVVLNRVASPDFPDTICEVVHQPSRNSSKPMGCQFSWTCDGKSDKIRDSEKYQSIIKLSRDILLTQDTIVDIVDGALYYHAVYVQPTWTKYFERVTRIDTHIFYKNKP